MQMKRTFNLIKQRILDSRQRMTLLLVSMFITLSCWAEVTGSYNSSTKTLSFSGSGTITSDIVKGVSGYNQATKVTIGGGITGIDNSAFSGCSALSSITIPGSVLRIGNYAFSSCTNLKTLELSEGETELNIGEKAFRECPIETFKYYRDFSYAGNGSNGGEHDALFYNKKSLKNVTIGQYVTSIPDYTFYFCENLTNANLDNAVGITAIPYGCFFYCSSLTSIKIPQNVTIIKSYAFHYCSSLKAISIPGSVTGIDNCAFAGCSALTSITIPGSVLRIGNSAFSSCI